MQELTNNANLKKEIIETKEFDIFTISKGQNSSTASIYIEGDGFAWKNRRVISNNPTPKNPVGLKLMLKEKDKTSIYIARPCQYVMQYDYSKGCTKDTWSYKRFSKDAVNSINQVINKYKKEIGFNNIELIGYSGGGAIAMLLTTKRNDIIKITTIAGNLDIDKWVNHHKIAPLSGSLNPADFKESFTHIPQVHYVGKQDKIVPSFITYDFIKDQKNAKIIEVDTNHYEWDKYIQ